MKISYNWLKDYIDINIETEELFQILTDIGLEVEGVETWEEVKGGLKNFYVGEVLTCAQHPNADKLSVTTVNIGGDEVLNIVCGAPNVAAGQKVIVAAIGAELFSDEGSFIIKKTKLRGEPSEGMICAEDEIGLGESHAGIMVLDTDAKVGTPAADYFNFKTDTIFEIGLTPNRIDAASHYGVARDLAAYFAQTKPVALKKPKIESFKEGKNDFAIEVQVEDKEACKRYAGLTIKGITVKPSPDWMQQKLKAIGLKPINNVVDITNYVLHELGQPLHAFDADKLSGNKIIVKKLNEGTPFVTLDEVERKLSENDLMICDTEKGACIAGVFGGLHSGVSNATKTIFLESAYFDQVSVRKTAKRHMLSTDASFRFERGVDPEITTYALKRAALLIVELAGGNITSSITDIYPEPIKPVQLEVKYSHIDRLIGKQLDRALIKKILLNLDIKILSELDDVLQLEVAPYRVDVTREADIIEELLRIYGYNNVEFSKKLNATLSPTIKPDNEVLVNQMSDFLASNGFNEIMSNSLTKSSYYSNLKTYPEAKCVTMLNPLSSDLGVMRQTLLFNGLEAIAYNINRKNANLRLFEYGRCYALSGKENAEKQLVKYAEDRRVGIYFTGNKTEASWNVADEKVNLFQLKAYCETLLEKIGVKINSCTIASLEGKEDLFSGGLSYSINNKLILELGMINGGLLKEFDIEQEVIFAEFRWDELLKFAGKPIRFKEMSKFPEVRRDLALLVNDTISFNEIELLAKQTEKKLLKRVNLFDFFTGKNIPQGKKSYGVSFYLQDEGKTLTDKEIDKIMNKLSQRLLQELEAELR
jgi:phenylalanyl-tRNA synthetase beta chain